MTAAVLSRLRRLSAVLVACVVVVGAVPVAATPATAVPGDPWYFDAFGVPAAHQQVSGAGVTVAVIDQHYNPDVPDLQGARVEPGANTCHTRWLGPPVDFRDGILPDDDPQSVQSGPPRGEHASTMAALIVGTGRGTGPGGTGVKGIAPGATVRMYSIGSPEACNNQGGAVSSAIAQAVMDGADIISISHGIGGTFPDEAIRYAVDNKVPVLWASGNEGVQTALPCCALEPAVIWVGAVDQQGVPWEKSTHGDWLTVMGPGVDIPAGGYGPDGTWDSTITRSGTSGATPIIAGLLALVMERYPDATGNQVIQHLVRHTTREGETRHVPDSGFGIPSLVTMLEEDPATWRDVNPLDLVERKAAELPGIQTDEQALAPPEDATPPADPTGAADRADEVDEGAAARDEDGGAAGPWWWLGGSLVLLAAGAAVLWRRRSDRPSGPPVQREGTEVAGAPTTATGTAPPGQAPTDDSAAAPAARQQGRN